MENKVFKKYFLRYDLPIFIIFIFILLLIGSLSCDNRLGKPEAEKIKQIILGGI